MSNVILEINGVDRSEYFRPPLRVSPGGDSVVGSATVYLSQQAGGLDIRPMDEVKIYIPFDTSANTGIASKGRLFGGHVLKRQTSNAWTEKLWALPCADYNIILKKHRRRAATIYAVELDANPLDDQITQLFEILQGASPDVQIDTSGTALTTAMPAVTYPGGHTWEWYLQQLLKTAHIEDPAVFPSYYMGVDTTSGGGDTFGNPKLWVYDGALTPASVATFSDTPSGGEKSVFEFFARDTDATAMSQVEQSWFGGVVVTATDATSQSNYPSPYEDFSGGTGFWTDGEVVNDTQSNNIDEAQALVDARILAKGAPRDSIKFGTYERIMPGEYIDLEWTLEGIPPGTQYRVATAAFDWEEPNRIFTTLTLNTRRLGLFDDGTEGYFAAPVEGDDVPPLPITNLAATTVYDPVAGQSWVRLTWDSSISPDAAKEKVYIMQAGTVIQEVILDDLYGEYSYLTPPSTAYQATVAALDNAGNESEPFLPPVSGTSAPPFTDTPLNPSFEEADLADATLPRYWARDVNGNATAVIDTAQHSAGDQSVRLTHGTGAGSDTAAIFQKIHISGGQGEEWVWGVHALGEAGKEKLTVRVVVVDEDDTPLQSDELSYPVTTDWRWYPVSTVIATNLAHSVYLYAIEDDAGTSAKKIWVDAVDWNPAGSEVREGVLTQTQAHTVANTIDQISLIDRARKAHGWRHLGSLGGGATFHESGITHDGTNYYVYHTPEPEPDPPTTDVRSSATLEGIAAASPSTDIAPVKYASIYFDKPTGLYHLWGTVVDPDIETHHYVSLSPTSGFTFSDAVDPAIIDADFKKNLADGLWYGVGFTYPPSAGTALTLLRGSAPEGPWTDMGNIFADTGFPPFATDGRPDPNLIFVGNRAYVTFLGRPVTALGPSNYPCICELDLVSGRAKGSPVVLLDERETWIGTGANSLHDITFLRVEGEPDRLFGFGAEQWGTLELSRVIAPDDGRRDDDVVRLDARKGLDLATNIAPTLRADTEWTADGLLIKDEDGGALGYPALAYMNEFTLIVEFTPATVIPSEINSIAWVGGADYDDPPGIHVYIEDDGVLTVSHLGDGGTPTVISTGVGVVAGTRYAVAFRKLGDELEVWVNAVSSGDDTTDDVLEEIEVWSLGGQDTLTQAVRDPFVGTIHRFEVTGAALPIWDTKIYPPKPREGTAFPIGPENGDVFYRTDLNKHYTYSVTASGWLGPEYEVAWSYRNTTQPYTTDGDVIAEYRIRAGKTLWASNWSVHTHVVSSNTGADYWIVALLKAVDALDIETVDTSVDSSDTWVAQNEVTSFTGNPFTPGSEVGFAIQIRKNGSPGAIYIDQVLVVQELET